MTKKIPKSIWLKVYDDGGLGGGSSYCRKPPEGFESVKFTRDNKAPTGCDHSLGDYTLGSKKTYSLKQSELSQKGGFTGIMTRKFKHCPECGAPNDLKKIKD